MNINNINVNIPNIGFKGKIENEHISLKQTPDTFSSSKIPIKEAVKTIAGMLDDNGYARFDKDEIQNFKKYYKENKIDVDTVKTFAETKLSMSSLSEIYNMQKDCPEDFKKNEIPKIKEKVLKYENAGNRVSFSQNIYEPKEEYSIRTVSDVNDKVIERTYQTDKGLIFQKANYGKGSYKIEKSYDYRNNVAYTKYTDEGRFEKETITREDKNGNLIRKEETVESPISGVYNVKYTYPDGHVEDVVKASIDPKTGIKTIKKDMKSTNGTRTEYLYEDDPKGNRILDYKITDKNGKVLMKDSQTFEKVSDNKFISSKNHRKYEIEIGKKDIKIKDLHNDKEAKIDFKTKISNEKEEVINLLKKIPGDELFETVNTVSNIIGLEKYDLLEAGFSANKKWVMAGDNLFVFLHELGHAKDHEYRTEKDVEQKKNNYFLRNNENIKKAYLKEKTLFNENFADPQRENMKYFLNVKAHYNGEAGGLSETIAEANALTSTYTNGEVRDLSLRAQYLQQHFPETIVAIKKEMEYKHDIEAIQYYGT